MALMNTAPSSGAMQRHLQQHLFIFRCRGTGHSAHFGVADRAGTEGLVDVRKLWQTFCHTHFFGGGTQIDAAVVVQPMGWRFDAVSRPCVALNERSEQYQKSMLSGVDVPGETGNFVAERGVVCRDKSTGRQL